MSQSEQKPAAPPELVDPAPHAERFWSKVDRRGPDECWPWTAARFEHRGGYGAFGIARKVYKASRVAWALGNGKPLPSPQEMVLHSCDNPPCCNPRHLSLGGPQRNAIESYHRNGRVAANRKLTPEIARTITTTYSGARGEIAAMAQTYGVSEAAVRHIVRGRQWKRAVAGVER